MPRQSDLAPSIDLPVSTRGNLLASVLYVYMLARAGMAQDGNLEAVLQNPKASDSVGQYLTYVVPSTAVNLPVQFVGVPMSRTYPSLMKQQL